MGNYNKRIRKYANKLGIYFSPHLKERMLENYQKEAKILAKIDKRVNKIINRYQLPIGYFYYYPFARELYGLKRRYLGRRLEKETEVCFQKWLMRGLNKDIMIMIKKEIDKLPLGE